MSRDLNIYHVNDDVSETKLYIISFTHLIYSSLELTRYSLKAHASKLALFAVNVAEHVRSEKIESLQITSFFS